MLRFFNVKTELSGFSNVKCGEIFFQTVENFSIVCSFCEIKSFDFSDFLLHFKNVHFDGMNSKQAPIYDECIDSKAWEVPTCELAHNEIEQVSESANNILHVSDPSEIGYVMKSINDDNMMQKTSTNKESSTDKSVSGSNDSEDSKDETYTPTVFKRTSTTTAPIKHQCTECSKSYKLPKSLECHKIKVHNADNVFKCLHCELEFSSERARSKHARREHDGFPCDQCNNTYKSKVSLNYHKSKHSGELNFVCDVVNCGKAFFNKKRLNAHKVYAHCQERKYVCEMCGFSMKSKQALVIHKRSHTGEKPYICNECSRCFASSSQLVEHKAMHSTERPHVCDVCGAAFARQKALYHHKHLHLDTKKFVCKICGKAYAQAAGLCGHMRQHKAVQF